MNKLRLKIVDKVDPQLKEVMARHYSQPRSFVGRSICYAIYYDSILYGFIVGGSAPKWLPGRDEFFGITKFKLNYIIDNIFFHIEKQNGKYPTRNFVSTVIEYWRDRVAAAWELKYGNIPLGFESLVELPRTGECYIRDGWTLVVQTSQFLHR